MIDWDALRVLPLSKNGFTGTFFERRKYPWKKGIREIIFSRKRFHGYLSRKRFRR